MQTNTTKEIKDFNIEQFQLDLLQWFQKEQRDLPWRKDKDPYKIWISEIMLQQTKVDTVIPYFLNFIDKFPTLQDLARAEEQAVLKAWEGLGYYSRARNLHEAVKEVVEEYDCIVPNNKAEISKLKGVGPYTTGAILSIAYGVPEPAVDGNVMRVFSRIFSVWDDISKVKTRKKFETIVTEVISKENPSDFNQALMELGAIVCTPKSPSCLLCPVERHCNALKEGVQNELPVKAKKKQPKPVELSGLVLWNKENKVLIRKRKSTGLLANLWEFPNCETIEGFDGKEEQLKRYIKEKYHIPIGIHHYLMDIKHVFSHLIWHMSVYEGNTSLEIKQSDTLKFVSLDELEKHPFPVSHQKIIDKILKL